MSVLKLSSPGVYVSEESVFPPSVAEVETAIPAFIGYTEKATKLGLDLTLIPTKINSLKEFELYYGAGQEEAEDSVTIDVTESTDPQFTVTVTEVAGKKSVHNMYYAMQHFYDNGGGTCFICSVGKYGALPGAVQDADLNKGLDAVNDIDEVTILVVPELQVAANYKSVVNKMITQAATLKDRFALIDPDQVTPKTSANPGGDIDTDAKKIREASNGVQEDRYAAAYYPNLITSYARNFKFADLKIDSYTGTGTDLKNKTMTDLGEGHLVYTLVKTELGKLGVELPPSPAMAGVYTRVDNTRGVWKAPANEPLKATVGPSLAISAREQESLNVDSTSGKSINAIRTFPGYGTIVWGGRTLAGNDLEWRYINVRRFFNMVEESIKKSIQWAVFEPNTINTWVKVQAMIENYLNLKWKDGALAGVKPEQAYYVRVGIPATMTSIDVLEGRMNVEIGMAVARPAEFIILKFSQMMQTS